LIILIELVPNCTQRPSFSLSLFLFPFPFQRFTEKHLLFTEKHPWKSSSVSSFRENLGLCMKRHLTVLCHASIVVPSNLTLHPQTRCGETAHGNRKHHISLHFTDILLNFALYCVILIINFRTVPKNQRYSSFPHHPSVHLPTYLKPVGAAATATSIRWARA